MKSCNCINEKCQAIFHVDIKTFNPHEFDAECPFCGTVVNVVITDE